MAVTPQKVREVLEAYARAWATDDKALLLSLFAQDAEWSDPVGTPPFRGHEGVGRFWDFTHQDAGRSMTPRVEEIRACGSEGILRFTMQVRIPSRNEGLDLAIVDYFQLDEAGKIRVAKAFWDESCVSVPPGMKLFVPDISAAYGD